MRLRSLIHRTVQSACALAAVACILLVSAAVANAVPSENVGPQQTASRAVATPTIVKETVIRPGGGTKTIVFVLIGVGGCVAILMAGYLGARLATRGGRPATHRVRPS